MPRTSVTCRCGNRLNVAYEGNPTNLELQAQITQESGWYFGDWRDGYRQLCPDCIPAEAKKPSFSEEVPF